MYMCSSRLLKVAAWQDQHCAVIECIQNYAHVVERDLLHFVSVNCVILQSIMSLVDGIWKTKGDTTVTDHITD